MLKGYAYKKAFHLLPRHYYKKGFEKIAKSGISNKEAKNV